MIFLKGNEISMIFLFLSNLKKNHHLVSNKNEKITGIFKKEAIQNIWIFNFISLPSKAYSIKCNYKNTN